MTFQSTNAPSLEWQECLFEEASKQSLIAVFACESVFNYPPQVFSIIRQEIGQHAEFCVCPGFIDGIAVGCVGGKIFKPDVITVDLLHESLSLAVSIQAVPDDQQSFPPDLSPDLTHEVDNVLSRHVGILEPEVKPEPRAFRADGDSPMRRETIMTIPTLVHRRTTTRSPGAANRGLKHEPCLVDDDYRSA